MKNQVSRRHFAQLGTAAWGSVALGCGQDQRDFVTDQEDGRGAGGRSSGTGGRGAGGSGAGGSSSGGAGTGGTVEPPLGGMGGVPRTCGELTRTNIEGPFFLAGSPERTDLRGELPGFPLLLSGVVYDTACEPLTGALVDFWQADETGAYDRTGSTFRGHQFTSDSGAYTLSSIIPGRYLNGSVYRPAHLHVKVIAAGHTLTTQLYFPDDPFNEDDAFFLPELVVRVEEAGDLLVAHFDFYVPTIL